MFLATISPTIAAAKSIASLLVRQNSENLTMRQFAVLLHVATDSGPHTVRGLAATLGISKPAVTRALDVLTESPHPLLVRAPDHRDLRSVLVLATTAGLDYLRQITDGVATDSVPKHTTPEKARTTKIPAAVAAPAKPSPKTTSKKMTTKKKPAQKPAQEKLANAIKKRNARYAAKTGKADARMPAR